MSRKVLYIYFKPSGKYKYEGEGNPLPMEALISKIDRDAVMKVNNGSLPGVVGRVPDLYIVILDSDTYPVMIPPETYE